MDIKTLVLVCFQDNWKNSQTLNNASQWTNKDQQVQTILVRSASFSSKPTHHNLKQMKIVGGYDSSSQTAQVIFESIDHNWFFCKNSTNSFQECTTSLSSFNFWKRRLLVFWSSVRCYHCETHSQKDLHFEAPISLLIIEVQHFAASTPFLFTHYLNLKCHTQDPGVHIDWSS